MWPGPTSPLRISSPTSPPLPPGPARTPCPPAPAGALQAFSPASLTWSRGCALTLWGTETLARGPGEGRSAASQGMVWPQPHCEQEASQGQAVCRCVALVTADTSEGLFLTVDVCPLRRVTSKREVPCLRHALPELHSEAPLGSWPPELGSRLCGSEQPRPARCPEPRPLPAGPTWWPRSAARRPPARCTPQGWTARGLGCCSRSLGLPRGPG